MKQNRIYLYLDDKPLHYPSSLSADLYDNNVGMVVCGCRLNVNNGKDFINRCYFSIHKDTVRVSSEPPLILLATKPTIYIPLNAIQPDNYWLQMNIPEQFTRLAAILPSGYSPAEWEDPRLSPNVMLGFSRSVDRF